MTSAAGLGRPRRWAAGLAWVLWALAMLGLAVVPWLDSLLRQAGRPDLVALVPGSVVGPVVAMLSAATVGAVLASRRPRHPVGWLLLGVALSLTASGVITSYVP
jgi:tellurite resistance protein TehA-like permease